MAADNGDDVISLAIGKTPQFADFSRTVKNLFSIFQSYGFETKDNLCIFLKFVILNLSQCIPQQNVDLLQLIYAYVYVMSKRVIANLYKSLQIVQCSSMYIIGVTLIVEKYLKNFLFLSVKIML